MIPLALILSLVASGAVGTAPPDTAVVVENFESSPVGKLPQGWSYFSRNSRSFVPAAPQMEEAARFFVASEGRNKFLRAYTHGEAQRLSIPDGRLNWNLQDHPVLRWSWRANQLPKGAREDRVNDSGGAVYVTFSKTDWLGRPLSIKYVYSSGLPVGTVVSAGSVKVVVVSSGLDVTGRWVEAERDVVKDYRKLFGGEPPDEPFTITLWSDSDNTNSTAEVDFDNIVVSER